MDAAVFACQLFVGSILFMSGVIKVLGFADFRDTVNKYALVPIPTERAVAAAIVTAELVAAVSLLTGELVVVGALLAAALFVAFIAAVGINIRRGVELDCGCFGLLWREKTGWPTIVRDAVLLTAALFVALAGPGATVREALADGDGPVDLLPAVAAAAVAAFATWIAFVAHRSNGAFEPPPPTPENLPPPGSVPS